MKQTISTLIKQATTALAQTSSTPQLDAEILLANILKTTRTALHTWPEREISEEQNTQFQTLIKERIAGKPIAYITGTQAFWNIDLQVTSDVLIPRADTEILVEKTLELYDESPISVLELGTGSGAIALAIQSQRPQWKIVATDKSEAALNMAKENAKRLGINSIKWIISDWFSHLQDNKFNLIISNPPYIAPDDPHLENLQHEPLSALIAQDNGYACLNHIIENAPKYLLPNGRLMLEHGFEQGKRVREKMHAFGFCEIQTEKDFGDNERMTMGVIHTC